MNSYTLSADPKVMGGEHPTYGWTFWGHVEESDFPVMFNSKTGNVFKGDKLFAEEQETKKSSRGTDYLRLKKVKISGSQGGGEDSRPTPRAIKEEKAPPAAAPLENKFLKDTSDLPFRLFTAALAYDDWKHIKQDSEYRREYIEAIKDIADELLDMIDKVRNPSGLDKARKVAKKYRPETKPVEPDDDWTASEEDFNESP